jgi:hypothetical protein
LSRTKRIAECPAFKEFEESRNVSTEGPKSTAEANVLARLFSSTPVKNVVPTIISEIRTLLGVDEAPAGKTGNAEAKTDAGSKEKPARKKAEESVSVSGSEDEAQPKQTSSTRDGGRVSHDMDISGDEESGSDDFAEFDARLGSGSDFEDEEDVDGDSPAKSRALADDISDSVSRSPSPDFSGADSPPTKKTKATKGSAAPAQTTTFLPSLMMGGYWSGSEDASEGEEAAASAPKRKNRMGQQARRALWEKKYGAGANHVQKEMKKQKRSRDSGWDTRKGATDGGKGDRFGGRGGFADRGLSDRPHNVHNAGGQQSGSGPAHVSRPKAPSKDNEGPLHPSWEAKKKLKEQASMAKFEGKKVTFD